MKGKQQQEVVVDVLLRARHGRAGWVAHGAGAFVGGWTLLLMLRAGCSAGLGGWLLLAPVLWALGFVIAAQVMFGLATLLMKLTRIPRKFERGVATVLVLAALSALAGWLMRDGASAWDRALGCLWWAGLIGGGVVAAFGGRGVQGDGAATSRRA